MGLFYWDMIPGSLKNSHPVTLIAKKLACPLPPIQCCYVALLGKAFKITAISVRMPACIGQQHWSRGCGGIRCDVTTCRRMVFFWRTRLSTEVHTICRVYVRWYITKISLDMVQSLHFRYPKWSLIMYWLTSLPDLTNDNFFGESFQRPKKAILECLTGSVGENIA